MNRFIGYPAAIALIAILCVPQVQDTATARACGDFTITPGPVVRPEGTAIYAISAVPDNSNDVWAVGDGQAASRGAQTLVEYWDGASWTVVPSPNEVEPHFGFDIPNFLWSVSAVAVDDVWAVGEWDQQVPPQQHGLIEHWDGSTWTIVRWPELIVRGGRFDTTFRSVSADARDDVWIAGAVDTSTHESFILHWDGRRWAHTVTPVVNDLDYVAGIHALSPTDVWAVGQTSTGGGTSFFGYTGTLIEHWNGVRWSVVPSPSPDPPTVNQAAAFLQAVSAVASDDVWAVGGYWHPGGYSNTLIEHWNGSQWTIVPSPSLTPYYENFLVALAPVSASEVWATGFDFPGLPPYDGLVMKWDGTTWDLVTPVTAPPHYALFGMTATASDVWAAGAFYDQSLNRGSELFERSCR